MWWDKEFKTRLSSLLIVLEMMKRYVDDINMAMPPIKPGTRYQDGAIHHREDLVDHDTGIKEDLRTMLLFKEIGNDTHPSVQLEVILNKGAKSCMSIILRMSHLKWLSMQNQLYL